MERDSLRRTCHGVLVRDSRGWVWQPFARMTLPSMLRARRCAETSLHPTTSSTICVRPRACRSKVRQARSNEESGAPSHATMTPCVGTGRSRVRQLDHVALSSSRLWHAQWGQLLILAGLLRARTKHSYPVIFPDEAQLRRLTKRGAASPDSSQSRARRAWQRMCGHQ